ncbi:DUF2971 domain-containing protein [Methanosarcina barkeri]|uniref:DUF2971 domain-containing protein n=1 Tax=Methanosarcina barkeri CM1 TaxID=796385 RepID=A0A0G3CCZ1_METBA|nr:DUF2971 domain-containing protein [Methanosarcina barkeri]AKJ39864.1 hypothetical protein MCM1_2868 [Methanosarcina barkeri CM1]
MFIYKYCSLGKEYNEKDFLYENLEKNQLYFNDSRNFNDPFDSKLKAYAEGSIGEWSAYFNKHSKYQKSNDEFLNLNPNNISFSEKEMTDLFDQIIGFLTCCFCEENNNILMWSHYANSHFGVCLSFRVKENPNSEFGKYELKLNSKYESLIEVKYDLTKDYPKSFNILDEEDKLRLSQFLINKSKCWKYEKEHRIILFGDDATNINKFEKEDLEGVIFGLNTNYKAAEKISQIIKEKYTSEKCNVKFYIATDILVSDECEIKNNECKIKILEIKDVDWYIRYIKYKQVNRKCLEHLRTKEPIHITLNYPAMKKGIPADFSQTYYS